MIVGDYDSISGYTVRQIEDAIEGQKTWSSWKTQILNTINNETSYNVQDSFDFWNTQ